MELLLIAALTFVAAAIGTITGFGTSTIMIPVLVMFFPPVEAIFLVAIIHWFGNVWKVGLFKGGINWRLFLLFGIVGLAMSYLGASLSLEVNEFNLLRALGVFLAGYSLLLIFQSRLKIPANNISATIGGAVSGFFSGMLGIGGAIRSAFLAAFDLPKAMFIATAGAIGLLIDSTRIITYVFGGVGMPERLWYGLLLFVPVSFLGALFAKKIVDRIPQKAFRTVIAVFLLLIGLKLFLWP